MFTYTTPCPECKGKVIVYMVHDHVWEEGGAGNEIICLDCFERRIGRQIAWYDLTEAVCNRWIRRGMMDCEICEGTGRIGNSVCSGCRGYGKVGVKEEKKYVCTKSNKELAETRLYGVRFNDLSLEVLDAACNHMTPPELLADIQEYLRRHGYYND